MRYNQAMSLTPEQVEHIARLARLELTAEERERFSRQLTAILNYFQQLQEVEVAESALTPPAGGDARLRADEVGESLGRDALLANAADHAGGQFKTPPVFQQGGSNE